MKFEEKLMTLRKKSGMSQEEMADWLGVTRQAVSRWELGSTQPDAPNLLKLSDLFDVSIDWLLRESDMEQEEATRTKEAVQMKTEKVRTGQKGFLAASIAFVLAAFAFLMAAIDRMNIYFVLLAIVDAILASVFLWKYLKSESKE